MFELRQLIHMGVRDVKAFSDSKLVVQQMGGLSQCLDDMLNCYYDTCQELIKEWDTFRLEHILRGSNREANGLAQQASGYEIRRGEFDVKWEPIVHDILD
jgi:ribonuclease HI